MAPFAAKRQRSDDNVWDAIRLIEKRLELDVQKESEREALDKVWQRTIESLHASQAQTELNFRRRNQWAARLLSAPAEVRRRPRPPSRFM
jgi:hypothetical protein